jgi:hypothetical protein
VAKSKYNAGQPPTTATLVLEATGSGTTLTSKTVLADGTTRTISYTSNYDGKDAAVTGSPDYDTVAITRTNARTARGERKKGGKVVQTYTRRVSADGKTMTVTATGTNAAGQKVDTVLVYEKQ